MNTKLSMRDKKLLLIFLGIAVFALGYFLVFHPQMDKAEALRAENVPLREKLNELKEIEENKDFYVQNDYGILAYMCINEVMEYWWLENGQCLQVSKLDPISKSVRLPWFDIEL